MSDPAQVLFFLLFVFFFFLERSAGMYFVSSSLPALFFFFSEGWGMVSPFRCCLPAKESEKALSFLFFFQ